MTETATEGFRRPSPSGGSPGSLAAAAPAAEETSRRGEPEPHSDMEVKQVTLCKRSVEVKRHGKKFGVLTADIISGSVPHLGCFGTALYHHHTLSLPCQNLSDISVLCNYVHLKKLELPHNRIRDLSCVSHLPYLVILDASHNEISDFFDFQPPKNLKEVKLSHNRMTKMTDLAAYISLSKLDLDYNIFTEISGLQQCRRLAFLSLAHNNISRISGLEGLPLKHLCLRGNQLEKIEGLESLRNLRVLDLSFNRITSLSGLQNLHMVDLINLERNLIDEILECKHIYDLFLLREVNLTGNPMQEQPDYRLAVLFLLQHLTVLDHQTVTVEEKVASVNKYDPPMDVVAAREHMTHLVYQLTQPQVLFDSTLPSADSPYPMLVLTGPQGCGKRELAHRLCQEFSEYFAYGIFHTTRQPYFGEEDGVDYHFVSEEDFEDMIYMGKFIQTMSYGGHNYGLSREAIEKVAREGLASCVHMELEGVFSLKNTSFEPRYILLIPTQVEKYRENLKRRELYTAAQIDAAVSRIELYANTNRQRPGFFDNVIACDDWEEACLTLGKVMKGYLLLEEQEERKNHNNRESPDGTFSARGHEPEDERHSLVSKSAAEARASPFRSALQPSNPLYRSYYARIQTELSSHKTPAELASIMRREQLVREAVVGKSPGVYSQLFKSSAGTIPSSVDDHDPGSQTRDDCSSEASRASLALSMPSSARALSGCVEALDMSILGRSLETPEGTDLPAAAACPSSDRRPGSDVSPVVPPIPTGRKTPLTPSPNPAIMEESASSINQKS